MTIEQALQLEHAIAQNHSKLYPVAHTIGNGEIVVLLRRYSHRNRKNVLTTFYILWFVKDWYQFTREHGVQNDKPE